MVSMHAVLLPPVRWTDDEPPGPHRVIRSTDGGESWHAVAVVDEYDDAADIAEMLNELADRRNER